MAALAIVNASIRTQDPKTGRVTALLAEGGRIRLLGDDEDIRSASPRGTQYIDAGGRLVLPGLTDTHAHFLSWALLQRQIQLADARSLKDALRLVADRAASLDEGAWVVGWGLDESGWPEGRLPTKDELEAASPCNPVFMRRRDGHLAVVNQQALRAAMIGAATPEPDNGIIDRGPDGKPTGTLRERAVDLVERIVPEPSDEEGARAILESLPSLHRIGLTGIYDYRLPGAQEGRMAARIFRRVRELGGFKVRCTMTLSCDDVEACIVAGLVPGSGDETFRVGHIKYFLDGSLGSQTAWMIEPYVDGRHGIPVCALPELEERISEADARGWPVAVHAIGDRANRELVDIFSRVHMKRKTATGGLLDLPFPHRIEHVQTIRPDDIARLAKLGVVASVQPLHATDDMRMYDTLVGESSRFAYRFRDLIAAGVPVVFGSDAPVSSPNPFWGIHAAVCRRRRDGDPPRGWHADQRITVEDAVRAYTTAHAASMGVFGLLGTLSPGKLADIVVLDRDIFSIDPMEIHDTAVLMTVFDGSVVYREGI